MTHDRAAVRWAPVWRADGYELTVEQHTGVDWKQYRVRSAEGRTGAVVIARCAGHVLLVQQHRIGIDRTLWEFPRGGGEAADGDVAITALRELREETGLTGHSPIVLGAVWVDSGLLANDVAVVVVEVDEAEMPGGEGGAGPAGGVASAPVSGDGEVGVMRWVPEDAIAALVRDGVLCDGITLAAWALAVAGPSF